MSKSKNEQLLNAALRGELEKVKSRANDPFVNVNWQQKDGFTALYGACQEGHLAIAEYLLNHPRIDPNLAHNIGTSPFYIACFQGHQSVVSLLLVDPRVDPSKPTNLGTTPFFIACDHGRQSVVSLLLADPRVDPNRPLKNNATPLWLASQEGHLAVVQVMLASGREIDTKTVSLVSNKTAAEQGRAMGTKSWKLPEETDETFNRRKLNGCTCANLIDQYEKDPATVRAMLRKQLGLADDSPLTSASPTTNGPPVTHIPTQKEKEIFFESLNSHKFESMFPVFFFLLFTPFTSFQF
jgi:hypothetical protein